MKKYMVCFLILLLIVLVGVSLRHHLNRPKKTFPQVSVIKRDIDVSVSAIGNIVPRHLSTVRSSLDGTVQLLYHDAGDFVKKGTPLLKIKPNPDPRTYAQAVALVHQYQAAVTSDQAQLDNLTELAKEKIISHNYSQLIKIRAQLASDQAQLDNAKQNLDLYDKGEALINGKWQRGLVVSPVTGFILQRNVDRGDSVISLQSAQAATTLFTIANMKDLIFKGMIDENDAHKLHLNMPATVEVGALPGKKIRGVVDRLALQSDEENQKNDNSVTSVGATDNPVNVGFELEVANLVIPTNVRLLSGYSSTASMILDHQRQVLSLPERVIHFKKEKAYVYIVDRNNQKKEIQVHLGISDGTYVQIKDGLVLDQKVIDVGSSLGLMG